MRALRSRDNLHEAIEYAVAKKTRECVQLLAAMQSETSMDRAVHDIRTRVKQLRVLLRLVREAIGAVRYQRGTRILRQISHALAGVRDAKVTLTTYDRLQQRAGQPESGAIRSSQLRRHLAMARAKLSSSARRTMAARLGTVQKLISADPHSNTGRQSNTGWKAVARALRHEYAGGRRAFVTARAEPSDAHLHELRKRSKGLLYLCDFLRKLSPRAHSLMTPLERLAQCLGDDHDLSLLNRAVRSVRVSRSAALDQEALRNRAWKLGAGIYRDTPAAFTKRIHREWKQRKLDPVRKVPTD